MKDEFNDKMSNIDAMCWRWEHGLISSIRALHWIEDIIEVEE